jgi:dTDP-glucose 4,6-dehydratase
MNVLVTGTLGFIFSNFIREAITRPGYRWTGVDKAARPHNLANWLDDGNYRFYLADIADAHAIDVIFDREQPDIVIGGAAESFVDDSITDIMPFLRTNIIGTQVLVGACLKYDARYIHISTDEVYGQLSARDDIGWTEKSRIAPRNPYAASKACAEHIVLAAHETHGLQYQITRSCNVYGPAQKKENLVPRVCHALIHNEPVPIHGTGGNFRQYLHVDDAIEALMVVMERGAMNTTYNVGGDTILSNLQVVDRIADVLDATPEIHFIADRKGHDFGYKVASNRLRELGWSPRVDFSRGIAETVAYYRRLYGRDKAA